MSHETRTAALRRAGRQGEFTARAVSYRRVDEYGSMWSPGVFNEALNVRLPVIAWAHGWQDPIGRATGWHDTAEGPVIEARLDIGPDVPRANQAAAQLESGTIDSVSVGFVVPKGGRREPTDDEVRQYPGVREVIERAEMDELSLVLSGAVPGARVLSVRSAPARLWEQLVVQQRVPSMSAGEAREAMAWYAHKRTAAVSAENERRNTERIVRDVAIEAELAMRAKVDPIDRLLGK